MSKRVDTDAPRGSWEAPELDAGLGCGLLVLRDGRVYVATDEIGLAFTVEQSREIARAVLGDGICGNPTPVLFGFDGETLPTGRSCELPTGHESEWHESANPIGAPMRWRENRPVIGVAP